MPPAGFEPTISAGERPQTHALDRAATETGYLYILQIPDDNYRLAQCNVEVSNPKPSPTPKRLTVDSSINNNLVGALVVMQQHKPHPLSATTRRHKATYRR